MVQVYLVDPWLVCQRRGTIPVKGKGYMITYYLELTEDLCLVERRRNEEEEEEVEERWDIFANVNPPQDFSTGAQAGVV